MNANFDGPIWAQLELSNKFYTDCSAGGSQVDLIQEFAADEPEIAIDVADFDAEQEPGESVIDVPDEDAMPGIVPLEFVAVYESDIGLHSLQQFRNLIDIVLAVPVGIKN